MKYQINALTATRAFAAVLVFIFHFGRSLSYIRPLHLFFDCSDLAVSYFFVLSGFVLYINYFDKKFTFGYFFKKRLGRIAPVYWLALGMVVFTSINILGIPFNDAMLKQAICSALFVQAYFPGYAIALNSAAWSICAEMLFYVLFPFLLILQNKNSWRFLILVILFFIVTQSLFFIYFKQNWLQTANWNFFLYNPIMHLNQFLIGMAGGYIFKEIDPVKRKYILLPFVLLCLIIAAIVLKPFQVHCEVGLLAPLFLLFILSVAINNPRFLNFKPLVFLGEISYGIYILQFPVTTLISIWSGRMLHLSEEGFFYFSLLALILAATVSYYLIEMPLRKKIGSLSFARGKSK